MAIGWWNVFYEIYAYYTKIPYVLYKAAIYTLARYETLTCTSCVSKFVYLVFLLLFLSQWFTYPIMILCKKVNKNVQEEPQAEVAAKPWHQEKEKKWHRLTCALLTNKCTISTKTSSPSPKQGDQNAKRNRRNTKTKNRARPNMKRLVV